MWRQVLKLCCAPPIKSGRGAGFALLDDMKEVRTTDLGDIGLDLLVLNVRPYRFQHFLGVLEDISTKDLVPLLVNEVESTIR